MRLHLAALALALALPSTLATGPAPAEPPRVRLLQRIFHPARPAEPFVDRGALVLAPAPASSAHAPGAHAAELVEDTDGALAAYLTAYASSAAAAADDGAEPVDLDAALYQLALQHPGDTHSAQWHVSSVKLCHLPHATTQSLTLHVAADGAPVSLDYFVGPVPHDGACPGSARARRRLLADVGTRIANTTVVVRAPTHPPLPSLRTPPQLSAEGKVVTPPQEKSFIQKYWMYIAIAFLALAVSGSPPEEEGQQGGGAQRR